MAVNESVNMEGVWLVYYAFPNEGVEGNSILTIKGDITLSELNKLTTAAGCELIEFNFVDTSLEGYFINLLEG